MKTQFTSNQYNVTSDILKGLLSDLGAETICLYDLQVSPSGYGHYSIEALLIVNDEELTVKSKTSNMILIDAYKSGEDEISESSDYDTWDEVIESMLGSLNLEEEILDFIG